MRKNRESRTPSAQIVSHNAAVSVSIGPIGAREDHQYIRKRHNARACFPDHPQKSRTCRDPPGSESCARTSSVPRSRSSLTGGVAPGALGRCFAVALFSIFSGSIRQREIQLSDGFIRRPHGVRFVAAEIMRRGCEIGTSVFECLDCLRKPRMHCAFVLRGERPSPSAE
jgi:hypothetical protein